MASATVIIYVNYANNSKDIFVAYRAITMAGNQSIIDSNINNEYYNIN